MGNQILDSSLRGVFIRRTNLTGQTIPGNDASTAITFDTIDFDTDEFFNITNNTRLTIPVGSGVTKILLGAAFIYGANATGKRRMLIGQNGTDKVFGQASQTGKNTVATGGTSMSIVLPYIAVNEGDYFELFAKQNSGSNITTSVNVDNFPYFYLQVLN